MVVEVGHARFSLEFTGGDEVAVAQSRRAELARGIFPAASSSEKTSPRRNFLRTPRAVLRRRKPFRGFTLRLFGRMGRPSIMGHIGAGPLDRTTIAQGAVAITRGSRRMDCCHRSGTHLGPRCRLARSRCSKTVSVKVGSTPLALPGAR